MNKYFILIFLFLISCSKSSFDISPLLSPPSWILGSWNYADKDNLLTTFESNDVIIESSLSSKFYLKDVSKLSSGTNTYTVKETSKDSSRYEIIITENGSEYAVYRWTKTSSTKLIFFQKVFAQSSELELTKK